MRSRAHHLRNRLFIGLMGSRKEFGKRRETYLGPLGSVAFAKPVSLADRLAFWASFDGRWRALETRHPRITAEDRDKVEAGIARRIPKPTQAEEREGIKQLSRPARGARATIASGRTKMDDSRGRPLL
jgi:hypothetical protein